MLAHLLALAVVEQNLAADKQADFLVEIKAHFPAAPSRHADADGRPIVDLELVEEFELIALVLQERQQARGAL